MNLSEEEETTITKQEANSPEKMDLVHIDKIEQDLLECHHLIESQSDKGILGFKIF